MLNKIASLFTAVAVLAISGCTQAPAVNQSAVEELALEIKKLGPEVDSDEAERAARIAYAYTSQLAQEYEITDPPLLHNYKVNNGFRERGLCVHWAEDIEARLKQENFQTLTLHRAIAPPAHHLRVDHSSTIVSQRGDSMYEGIVLDGWRYGGVLHWTPTLEDDRYTWRPNIEVLEEKYKNRQATREAAINL